jgi:hypothetical protein
MYLVGPIAPEVSLDVPILRLDRVWLADHAPRVQRARPPRFFVGPPLVDTLQRIAAHAPDDSLRPAIERGQQLYRFTEILQREGPQRAEAWYASNVRAPLPRHIFAIDQPARMNWPFVMEVGLFLVARAQAQAP